MPTIRNCLFVMAFIAVTVFYASSAAAFCGFYVAGGDASLFNDATQVAMVREGTRTVLSMQNNYRGPAEGFAMVVPVPQVLDEEHVRTLDGTVFRRLDALTAPRLVEYWEEDPCGHHPIEEEKFQKFSEANASVRGMVSFGSVERSVTVEARYSVGEYDIEVLSAEHSSGLYEYLRRHDYNVPHGAAPYLQPYIEQGSYFFVARVDPGRARFEDGEAVLSPLQFDYESTDFRLPIRLGMINSEGRQDLLVYLFGRQTRYEAANYANVFIPTNIDVSGATRRDFGSFYGALFEQTVAQNPGAVVTEYAWGSTKCDPCPEPVLDPDELYTLGVPSNFGQWTITRLHARYAPDDIGEDLVFRETRAARGGIAGIAHQDAELGGATNRFQGRYIIRNRWTGPITCNDARFGNWSGSPRLGDAAVSAVLSPNSGGEAPAGADLEDYLEGPVFELDIIVDAPWWAARSVRNAWGMLLTAMLLAIGFIVSRCAWRRSKLVGIVALIVGGLPIFIWGTTLTWLFALGWWSIWLESFVLWVHRPRN